MTTTEQRLTADVAQRHRLQGGRPVPGRVRPQGDPAGRTRDARADGAAPRVRRRAAAEGRAHLRLAAHDGADRRADRDAGRARRRGPLGIVQHLLHPGPCRGRDRRRPARHRRGAQGRAGVRLEGRDPRGVLVGRRADADLARRAGQHDPRRRRRRHHAGAARRPVREGRRGSSRRGRRLRRVQGVPGADPQALRDRQDQVDQDRRVGSGRHRGDHHRRAAAVPVRRRRRTGSSRPSTSTTRSPRPSSTTSTAPGTR